MYQHFVLIGGVSYLLYRCIARFIGKKLLERLTAVNDLLNVGKSRPYRKIRGTAVVCGGSVSGLLSAKACAAHFDKVIVVEAEEWLSSPIATISSHRDPDFLHRRSRVAQYKAAHIFQPFLLKAMCKWFPEFESEIEKRGAKMVPLIFDAHLSGSPLAQMTFTPEEMPMIATISRPTFETLLRKLVLESCPNVQYTSGTAIGLVQDPVSQSIEGVHVRNPTGDETTLPATLVVDCTGPAMGGFRWLKELAMKKGQTGAPRLDALRQSYSPKLRYATYEFNVPSHFVPLLHQMGYPESWETNFLPYLNHADREIDCRGMAILKQEHNYLQFVCGGWTEPRIDMSTIADIRDYMASLKLWKPLPEWISATLDFLEEHQVPFTVVCNSLASCSYIPYHLYEDLPSNFIAIGDAGMLTNPLRAVGCTRASVEAVILNNLLFHHDPDKTTAKSDKLPADFSRRFGKLQARRTGPTWKAYKIEDYGFKTTIPSKGDDLSYGEGNRRFNDMMLRLMKRDTEVMSIGVLVRGFLRPATDLIAPRILAKMAWMRVQEVLGLIEDKPWSF